MIRFQQKKVNPPYKYCPVSIGTAFSNKFVQGTKVKKKGFEMDQIQFFALNRNFKCE